MRFQVDSGTTIQLLSVIIYCELLASRNETKKCFHIEGINEFFVKKVHCILGFYFFAFRAFPDTLFHANVCLVIHLNIVLE